MRRSNAVFEPEHPDLLQGLPNLFLGKPVTTSTPSVFSDPNVVVNGNHEASVENWAAGELPAWVTIDIGYVTAINVIRLWTDWSDDRRHRYLIEGSVDEEEWGILVDRREAFLPSGPRGELFYFQDRRVRYVRIVFMESTGGGKAEWSAR